MATETAQRVHDEHVRRVTALDPLVAISPLRVERETRVLWSDDESAWIALDRTRTDPATSMSLWVATEVTTLRLRAATDDGARAAAALLGRAADVAPPQLELHLTTPSRDVAVVLPLLQAGFAPSTVLAVRRTAPLRDEPLPLAPAGVTVRLAGPDDAPAMTAARLALHTYETRVSLVPRHRHAERLLAEGVAEDLRDQPGWSWVAEQDGRVVGVCDATPPERAQWVAGQVAAEAVAYLTNLHVSDTTRGAGVGAALAAAAHAALAEAGASVVALHHGSTNPLSGPFWARAGYRPLHTTWVRQPSG